MRLELFDFEMVDEDTLVVPDGGRLVRVLTSNSMDSAYCIVPGDLDGDELDDALRLAFRRRYGNSQHGPRFMGYEDATCMLG